MADDQTVIDHLLQGRQALERDMERLNAELQRLAGAVEQLDSVIDLIGSDGGAAPTGRRSAPLTRSEPGVTVNTSAAAKTAARSRKPRGNAPKSIRVHVLEMLAEDNREWSLSEIIDRIHAAGIQAHDDAVRSITIKLMKDGRVERIGRGQYRLARRGSARAAAPVLTPVDEPAAANADGSAVDAPDTADTADTPDAPATDVPADEGALYGLGSIGPSEDDGSGDWSAPVVTGEGTAPDTSEVTASDDSAPEAGASDDSSSDEGNPYTPPLNLGQPWR